MNSRLWFRAYVSLPITQAIEGLKGQLITQAIEGLKGQVAQRGTDELQALVQGVRVPAHHTSHRGILKGQLIAQAIEGLKGQFITQAIER
jgi:hypothetical protein